MKVIMINGSPHKAGNTFLALSEMKNIFDKNNVDSEIIQVGHLDIPGCKACGYCYKNYKCNIDDIVNETLEKIVEAEGLVVGSPVYFASANATVDAFLDRLFYVMLRKDVRMKVGAAVCSARRGGITASFDQINKYFTIAGMPIASSQYWNGIHGNNAEEGAQDKEGLQTMRTLANNMIFLMKSIQLGKEKFGLPEKEEGIHTNFIR